MKDEDKKHIKKCLTLSRNKMKLLMRDAEATMSYMAAEMQQSLPKTIIEKHKNESAEIFALVGDLDKGLKILEEKP